MQIPRVHSPYTSCYAACVLNAKELVTGGGDVKIWLFLVDKECVRHPNVFDKLRAHAQSLHACSFFEC